MPTNNDLASRRRFLRQCLELSGTALVLSACADGPGHEDAQPAPSQAPVTALDETEPSLPDGLNPDNFILYSTSPLTLESKRDKLGMGGITATSLLFVRNNLPLPSESIVDNSEAWRVELTGLKSEASLGIAELKSLGVESLIAVLQCSGNGRGFFAHEPSGSPWKTGAAGCVMWTGVPLRAVVEKLGGVLEGKRYLTATGGEVLPEAADPEKSKVERSILVEKALRDCLLVWEINGQPLPISHGGPLRLIVPGYYGCNQIKYVKRLAFTAEQSPVKMQQSSYRIRPIGESGNASQPSMWRMNVKSWLNGPGSGGRPIAEGVSTFYGVAFSGERRVAGVEYSIDDGQTWNDAVFFGPDLGIHAWRSFRFSIPLAPGQYTIATRATDEQGETQPAVRLENHRGYANNSWRDLALSVEVLPAAHIRLDEDPVSPAALQSPAAPRASPAPPRELGPDPAGFHQHGCATCHTLADAGAAGEIGPNLDVLKPTAAKVTDAVTNGVGVMPAYGETLSSAEISQLASYVADSVR